MKLWLPDGSTQIAGLLGWPLSQSPSPHMHSRWFLEQKVNAIYLPFPVPEPKLFEEVLHGLLSLPNFLGANLTAPFKRQVLHLAGLKQTPVTKATLAANTLFRGKDGVWTLDNTDVEGARFSLLQADFWQFLPENTLVRCVVFGGGGAALAALEALRTIKEQWAQKLRWEFNLCTRSPAKVQQDLHARASIQKVACVDQTTESLVELFVRGHIPGEAWVIVNTLPLGHNDENNPPVEFGLRHLAPHFAKSHSQAPVLYFDMIYRETPAVRLARSLSFCAQNGKAMLTAQAQASFRLWTGQFPQHSSTQSAEELE